MTTPTRLAEIAERQAEQQAFETWAREASPFAGGDGRLYARAGFKAGWAAQLTAAQARSREDAEIMREAEGLVEAGNLRHDHNAHLWCCNICDAEVRDDALPNMRAADACKALLHTPDCLVTKLRARADEMEGRTDG